ncbi:amine sulfotransferase [Caerostris darwini]|uniref:Amine sulfotransferase n=1 Tax=Caerostris darwini TaxID=1538125 RepID=A0AAV4S1M0_9ARAC|nr:amine sulfotransferase [Caerostris darwini]
MANVMKRPRYAKMNGLLYSEMLSPKCFQEALEYKPKAGDVFIDTYPKCGTTWMQNVAMYIFRKGKKMEKSTDFLKLAPFIDLIGLEGIINMPRPGAFKTHLPYSYMPHSPDAKYIFVARNPKDCCVSFFYHTRDQPGFGYWDGGFDDFFELFMAGELEYNDYFDHLLDWYLHINDPNVFYTTYEDMKKDIKGVILKLSRFLGDEYIEAIEKDNAVFNNIIRYSGFDYMKKISKMRNLRESKDMDFKFTGLNHAYEFIKSLKPPEDLPEFEEVRKGIVGDWRNHFSVDQTERINRKILEKMKDTEVLQWFPIE